jgi:hypothetical protein
MVAVNALFGCALGVLFTALLVAAAQGPVQDVLQEPDATIPLLCLTLNMAALLATCVVATSWSLGESRERRREGPGGGGRALVAIRVERRAR